MREAVADAVAALDAPMAVDMKRRSSMSYCWLPVSPVTVCSVSSCASESGSPSDVSSGTGTQLLQFAPGAVDLVRTWNVAVLTVTAVCASHSRSIALTAVVEVLAINPVGTAMLEAVPTTAVAAELPSAVDT